MDLFQDADLQKVKPDRQRYSMNLLIWCCTMLNKWKLGLISIPISADIQIYKLIGSLNIGFCSAYLMRVFMFCSLKFSDFTLSIVCHVHHPYLYSSMEISDQSGMSAESVAILLLKKFSEKQLPKASELEWLVPISEAPQEVREKKRWRFRRY